MKAIVIVDIPENENVNDLFAPFDTKVTLDYGSEIIYLEGEIHPIVTEPELANCEGKEIRKTYDMVEDFKAEMKFDNIDIPMMDDTVKDMTL